MRGVVERMLEVKQINYSIPQRFDPATDTVVDDNGLNIPIDFEAEQQAADKIVAEEVAAAVLTWQFKDELTADEQNRLTLLNKLLAQQLRGKTVGIKKLKKALTADEFADYEQSLTEPITADEALYADGVPYELKRYNLKLREADFQNNKYEKLSDVRRRGMVRKNFTFLSDKNHRADHLYESALEYLQEQIEVAARDNRQDELLRWLDRNVDFTSFGNISPDAVGVPRVKGSRSHNAQDAGLPKLSVRLKREQRVLENLLRAAEACAYVPEPAEVAKVPIKLHRIDLSKLHSEKD